MQLGARGIRCGNPCVEPECEGDRDIIESVLGEKLEFKLVKLAEDPALAERFRELDVLIHAQARELTQLRQKVKEGRDDCVLLVQHLTDLLTHKDLDKDQGQGLREQLTEGHRLAERLARKFSPGKGATDPDCTGQLHGPQESSHLTRHVLPRIMNRNIRTNEQQKIGSSQE